MAIKTNSSGKKGQTFMFGAVILMISNILVKLIGAVFKIPLQLLIGDNGMAYFQAAYDIYVTFYMISTAGIPVAISRMIATSNSKGNHKEVDRIFKIAYWVFFVVGAIGTVAMIVFAKQFANATVKGAEYAMIAIAPTLFFICLSSAYRGYFQGLQNMVPTAVSQVIESAGKLGVGLVVGWYFLSRGYSMPVVAAFTILGVTIGVVAATVYIAVFKKMFASAREEAQDPNLEVRSTKSLLYELVIISIPISLASSIMGLTNTVDAVLVTNRLSDAGYAYEVAKNCYGAYAMPKTLFNMPTTLIYPFAISALPAISKYFGSGEKDKAEKLMESTFRMASIVALPCALGMSAMAKPILGLLFTENMITDTATNIDIAGPCLMVLGISVFFLGMISVTNSVLQAYGFHNLTIVSTVGGIIAKIIVSYILLGIKSVGLSGAAIGTAACYLTIMVLNMIFIAVKVGYFPSITRTFLKPFVSALVCACPCVFAYNILTDKGLLGAKLATLVSICIAGGVYLVMLLLLRGLSEEDIKMLPKSQKIIKILRKAKLLGD